MTDITVDLLASGVPVNGLANVPTISIMRLDTFAVVVAGSAMTDTGALGKYTFPFTPLRGIQYSAQVDADPTNVGQVDTRYHAGSFDREVSDLWKARGLDPNNAKSTTEITPKVDYDEDVDDIHIDQVKAGNVITTSST